MRAHRASRRRGHRGPGRSLPTPGGSLLPQAIVVAILAGGTTAFVSFDKVIELDIDGQPRTFHTFADDVGELLHQQGIAAGEHDTVTPGPGTELDDGDEVVIHYGRPIALTVDGEPRTMWTTATTVGGALHQFGIRTNGGYLSHPMETKIGRNGIALDVRTVRTITFLVDGHERWVRSSSGTVRDALGDAGIKMSSLDTTSVAMDSFPRDGQRISVLRITGTTVTREEAIPYRTVRQRDDKLFQNTVTVATQGEYGAKRVVYAHRTINGVKQKPKKIEEKVIRKPVTQVMKVGTKPLPTTVDGADGLNWAGLAQCETGGKADAVDPSGSYGGLYQFDASTWHRVGGSGLPQNASPREQTYRARKLYVQRGASPWPVCGRRLYT